MSPHGSFIWYELVTPDPDASKAFYDAVVGWTVQPRPDGPVDYRMIAAPDGGNTGGVMHLTPEMQAGGARAGWLGYVGVDDVDTSADQLKAQGGAVLMGPWDLPGVGRMAVVTDPAGAPFYLMRGPTESATSTAFAPEIDGHVAWNELASRDPEGALAFYGALFGWTNPQRMSMGAMGDYAFLHHGETVIGAVAPAPGEASGGWTFYFRVSDPAAAAERVRAAGGTVRYGPQEVPGGNHVVGATDPHGTSFGLVGPGR